jgi:peptide/nickel transport system substrate-binding protein
MMRHKLGSILVLALLPTILITGAAASTSSPTQSSGTLTVGFARAFDTVNPLQLTQGTPQNWFTSLAYDSLVRRTSLPAPRTYQPDLATSWRYSRNNTVFTMQLRRGVRFADGSPVNAQAVVRSLLNWRRTPNFSGQTWAGAIRRIEATGSHTVRLRLSEPNPHLPFFLSQDVGQSVIISPRGLADPSRLGSQTFGAGPYMLDSSQTQTGAIWTYVRNPRYWDKSKQHWDTVILRRLPNENSALSALRTGQVDLVVLGSESTLEAAANAGLRIAFYPTGIYGILLADRQGRVLPALRDVRVRQALNFAIDRRAIVRATFGRWGTPAVQMGNPIEPETFNRAWETHYTYNPTRAQQLMRQAGFADGFSARLLISPAVPSLGNAIQAVARQWEENLGVKVELVRSSSTAQFQGQAVTGQYPLISFNASSRPWQIAATTWNTSEPTNFNPYGIVDSVLATLGSRQIRARSEEEAIAIGRQMTRRLLTQAWTVTLVRAGQGYAYSNRVRTIRLSSAKSNPDLAWDVRPR